MEDVAAVDLVFDVIGGDIQAVRGCHPPRGNVQRVRDGRLQTNIGQVATLDDAVAAFNRTERITGQTIIQIRA